MSWGPKNTRCCDTTGYCKLLRAFIVIDSFSKEKRKILSLPLQTLFLLTTQKDVTLLLRKEEVLPG